MKKNISKKSALLGVFLLILPVITFAQDWPVTGSAFGASTGHDLSLFYLSEILGTVGNVLHSVSGQFVGQLFYHFNLAILVIAGLWLSYSMGTFALKASQEGSWMGQNRNSAVILLRVALGIGMLIPSPATGYSIFQDVVAKVVVYSVKLADVTWDTAIDYIVKDGGALYYQPKVNQDNQFAPISNNTATSLLKTFQKIEASEACMYLRTAINRGEAGSKYATPYSIHDDGGAFVFGYDSNSLGKAMPVNAQCGSLIWNHDINSIESTAFATIRRDAFLQAINDLQPVSQNLACHYLAGTDYSPYTVGCMDKTHSIQELKKESSNAIVKALLDYSSIMLPTEGNNEPSAASGATGASIFAEIAKSDGWASAGSYFWTLINFQEMAGKDNNHLLPKINASDYQPIYTYETGYVSEAAKFIQGEDITSTGYNTYQLLWCMNKGLLDFCLTHIL